MNRLMLEHCGCEEIRDRLSEYIDEELGALDRARVVLHLAACPRCHATAVGLARTVKRSTAYSGVKAAAPSTVSTDASLPARVEELLQRIPDRSLHRRRHRRLARSPAERQGRAEGVASPSANRAAL